MQFEFITAHAFGPFRGESLELAQGMTVIHGPNESGKSTWHAALYAGLCGIRRGRGAANDNRDFGARHKPWDGGGWEVSLIARLADGRHVELRHDLEGRVACQARDADTGRDYSSEIIFEGNPDGSRWLGLDRRTFLSTACVRQGDIQTIKGQAGALQEHMQRAAATAGADATAATAITKIESFLRDNVGTERSNSTRPLRTAIVKLEQARQRLEDARANHSKYLEMQEEIERLQISLANERQLLQSTQERLDNSWRNVDEAATTARNAHSNLEAHQTRRPFHVENVDTGNLAPAEIRHIAAELELEEPPVDPAIEERVVQAKAKLHDAQQTGDRQDDTKTHSALMAPLIFLLRILANLFRSIFGRRKQSVDHEAVLRATEDLRKTEAAQAEATRPRDVVRQRKEDARNRANQAGLPANSSELIGLADSAAEAIEAQQDMNRWQGEEQKLNVLYNDAVEALVQVLRAQGVSAGQDALKAVESYERECERQVEECRQSVQAIQTDLATKRGRFEEFSRDMYSVAEAEEALENAGVELSRVTQLRLTLNKTLELLKAAQDKVHRSLAPELRGALRPHINKVTSGRYQNVQVDVESLGIQVSGIGGNWRDASLLSHGTAEQIYLLLRVAMSRYLTKNGEVCPLILDDITVNCDAVRQKAVLSLLHEISSEQQVILFSQEPETLEWAQEHLSSGRDSLIQLEPASDPP